MNPDRLKWKGLYPGVATQTNNYRGLVQKIHEGLDYVHIIVYKIYIMFQIIRLYFKLFRFKSFKREAGEKPPRGVGKRVRVRAHKPI